MAASVPGYTASSYSSTASGVTVASLRFLNAAFHGASWNALSTSSSEAPRVSGWNARHTNVVSSEQLPNRKYGPDDVRARNIGVVNAMIQLMTFQCTQYVLYISRSSKRSARTHPVCALPETRGSRARARRLDLAHDDARHDRPARRKPDDEHVDEDDDRPAPRLRRRRL